MKQEKTFKEEYIKMLENELERPRHGYISEEENSAFKDGIKKALNIFKMLGYGKEVLAFEPFCEIYRVDPKDL